MALEAVVYPQEPFAYNSARDYYSSLGLHLEDDKPLFQAFADNNENNNNNNEENHIASSSNPHAYWDHSSSSATNSAMQSTTTKWWVDPNNSYYSSPETTTTCADNTNDHHHPLDTAAGGGRRKRRRSRSSKNKEEIENQRMTHIAVERNRRKQMNDYLAVLRSLMPPSYSQRGDQASIIGGAINFVKELEQLLQSMETHKLKAKQPQDSMSNTCSPFADFFSFPQYSTRPPTTQSTPNSSPSSDSNAGPDEHHSHRQHLWAVADIEVTTVESHASMKILSKKKPRQLLKLVAGLHNLRLSVLHLNVTTVGDSVLYSVSVKVEEGCQLNSVDEIASGVHELLRSIEEEAAAFS